MCLVHPLVNANTSVNALPLFVDFGLFFAVLGLTLFSPTECHPSDELFLEFDIDSNGLLNEEEIVNVTLPLLLMVAEVFYFLSCEKKILSTKSQNRFLCYSSPFPLLLCTHSLTLALPFLF